MDDKSAKNARLGLEIASDFIRDARGFSEANGNVLEVFLDCLDRDLEFAIRITKVYEKMNEEKQEQQSRSIQDESGMSSGETNL